MTLNKEDIKDIAEIVNSVMDKREADKTQPHKNNWLEEFGKDRPYFNRYTGAGLAIAICGLILVLGSYYGFIPIEVSTSIRIAYGIICLATAITAFNMMVTKTD